MAVAGLLGQHPHPTDEEIDAAITNICRCGTFVRVRRAIHCRRRGTVGGRHAQMDTACLHRHRHAGRRRLRARRRWRRASRQAVTASCRTTRRRTGELNTWITVTPDNLVTVLVPHCEMGQGAQTALAMMAAEEMEADWKLVRVKEAPALDAYANAYIARAVHRRRFPGRSGAAFDYGTYRLARWYGTTGDRRLDCRARHRASTACRGRRGGERNARRRRGGAFRRARLRNARPRIRASSTRRRARAPHSASSPSAAAKHPRAVEPGAEAPDSYTIRRTARPRFDIPSKVDGSAIYGIDFTVPGMLYAAVDIAPV